MFCLFRIFEDFPSTRSRQVLLSSTSLVHLLLPTAFVSFSLLGLYFLLSLFGLSRCIIFSSSFSIREQPKINRKGKIGKILHHHLLFFCYFCSSACFASSLFVSFFSLSHLREFSAVCVRWEPTARIFSQSVRTKYLPNYYGVDSNRCPRKESLRDMVIFNAFEETSPPPFNVRVSPFCCLFFRDFFEFSHFLKSLVPQCALLPTRFFLPITPFPLGYC